MWNLLPVVTKTASIKHLSIGQNVAEPDHQQSRVLAKWKWPVTLCKHRIAVTVQLVQHFARHNILIDGHIMLIVTEDAA